MTELEEITNGKNREQLINELDFQLNKMGEDINSSICSHIIDLIEFKHCHISEIKAGDTVFHDNKLMTVCENNINDCPFMGVSIFGDTYRLGTKQVKLYTRGY